MKYCYLTMKTAAIKNPSHMKISVEEFVNRFDMWSIFIDTPDELEEIAAGLMDGLTDSQIKAYIGKFITKKEMIALRVMLANGASMQEVNKVRGNFESHNRNAIRYAEHFGPFGTYHLDSNLRKEELMLSKRSFR